MTAPAPRGRPFPAHTVTHLHMTERPAAPGLVPDGLTLARCEAPPPWWFLALYDAVGRDYRWTDMHDVPEPDLRERLEHPRVELWALMGGGWPRGFFLLDGRGRPATDLAYFGLVPEAVGQGWSRWFLGSAVHRAWSLPGTARVTVNTCTLDHPRALPTYERAGFTVLRREDRPGGIDPC